MQIHKIINRLVAAAPLAAALFVAVAPDVFAAPPQLVTGATNLLNDATTWLLGLIPVGAGAALGYHAVQKQLSDGDPNSVAQINHKMRNVLVGGAVGESAVGLTKAFLGYFQ